MTFERVKKVRTRKERKCFTCCEIFSAGSYMEMSTSIQDARWFTYYICQECEKYIDEHDLRDSDGLIFEGDVCDDRASELSWKAHEKSF